MNVQMDNAVPQGSAFRAELMKLSRNRTLLGIYGAMIAFSVLATTLAFAVASNTPKVFNEDRPGATVLGLRELAQSDGASRGFLLGSTFVGIIVLVMFAVSIAGEYTNGTLRTLALFEPRRLRLLSGKVAALMVFITIGFALAEIAGIGTAYIAAAMRGIPVHEWTTGAGLQANAAAFGNAALAGLGWGMLGTGVAVAFRSVPVTLAVALAWIFPFENIMHRSWAAVDSWFPGLLLQGLGTGTGGAVSWTRALFTLAIYCGVIAIGSGLSFVRRDITA
jgi:ABC-2 type transport system permease protein